MPLKNPLQITPLLRKLHLKELLSVLFLLLAIYFFRQERHELRALVPAIEQANRVWMLLGIVLTLVYICLQALMYQYSFKVVGARLSLSMGIELFLKRNLLSVFLPAGGVSSLAYLPPRLRGADVNKQQVHQASGIYGYVGILSVFLVGIPVVVIAILRNPAMGRAVPALSA